MLNFFGSSAKPKKPSSSSSTTTTTINSATASPSSSAIAAAHRQRSHHATATSTPPPLKTSKASTSTVVVTTTRKLVRPPPAPSAAARDTIEAISGYRPINALSEQKRRQILEDRAAAQREKRKAYEAAQPKPSSSSAAAAAARARSKQSSRAPSVSSDGALAKSRSKRRTVWTSDEDDDDDDFGTAGKKSRRGSRAPSTPSRSKRRSVDPGPSAATHSYQKLGREGVLPSYSVPRDILADNDDDAPSSPPIQSREVVESSIKGFGPFFHGLGDRPKAVLEYPAKGQSEEYLLLVPRDRDEYDPLLDLLSTVKTIVSNYLTPEQQELFGSLDSLEISSNAGMTLPGAGSHLHGSAVVAAQADLDGGGGHTMRARSVDVLDGGAGKEGRRDEFGLGAEGGGGDEGGRRTEPEALAQHRHDTPESDSQVGRKGAYGHSRTAPASPSLHAGVGGSGRHPTSVSPAKAVMLSNAALCLGLDSAVPLFSPPSSQGSASSPTAATVNDGAAETETTTTMTTTTATAAATTRDPDSILRSFTKARNRRDGALFVRTLARFNAQLCELKASGAIARNIAQMGARRGVAEGVWRLIQEQVYARTVGPRVEMLGRYSAFSDNVYGELLPRFMSEIAQLTGLGPGKVFVDLGSGVGNLLVQISLQTGAEAYGCEVMEAPAELAERQIREARKRWKAWGVKGGPKLVAWKGDFSEHDGVREVLRRADVVLVNNYAFLPKTNEKLSLLFLDLRDGACIVSLKPFVPSDFRVTERTLSSPLAILRTEERRYESGCVSWADGGGRFFIQKVDRSLVGGWDRGSVGGERKRRWKWREHDEDE
ncbi:Nucleosomal histone H3-Lys79 methylase [Thecaphora frezii]